jgi:hypothetical protein
MPSCWGPLGQEKRHSRVVLAHFWPNLWHITYLWEPASCAYLSVSKAITEKSAQAFVPLRSPDRPLWADYFTSDGNPVPRHPSFPTHFQGDSVLAGRLPRSMSSMRALDCGASCCHATRARIALKEKL